MENGRDTASFTTRNEASHSASDFTKFYFETGKNTGPDRERFPTGWEIRRTYAPYTIARISLQMSFPFFLLCSSRVRQDVNAHGKGLRFTATLKGLNRVWIRFKKREKEQTK